jgi:hypothetical protein
MVMMRNVLHIGLQCGLLMFVGATPCVAILTDEEQRKIEDFESIHGFMSARLLFNLAGNREGTLQRTVDLESESDLLGLWITAADALSSIYENLSERDPITLSKKFGEINYLNYGQHNGHSINPINLVPMGAGGAWWNSRPFQIPDQRVTTVIPLAKQAEIRRAAITYNSHFLSPENLGELDNAASDIIGAFAGNFNKGDIFKFYQNFMYHHVNYVAGRLVPENSAQQAAALVMSFLRTPEVIQAFLRADPSQLSPVLRPFQVFLLGVFSAAATTGLVPQDHTREFPPHIVALFNLTQSLKVLCAFLGVHPFPDLKVPNGDDARTRDLISSYEIMTAEVVECLKNLDNTLFGLLSRR